MLRPSFLDCHPFNRTQIWNQGRWVGGLGGVGGGGGGGGGGAVLKPGKNWRARVILLAKVLGPNFLCNRASLLREGSPYKSRLV
jgi:hypothetical protein